MFFVTFLRRLRPEPPPNRTVVVLGAIVTEIVRANGFVFARFEPNNYSPIRFVAKTWRDRVPPNTLWRLEKKMVTPQFFPLVPVSPPFHFAEFICFSSNLQVTNYILINNIYVLCIYIKYCLNYSSCLIK